METGGTTMPLDPGKMILSDKDAASAQKAFQAAEQEFLDPHKLRANVVGMGIGVKWRKGEPTGEPALVTLVSHKVEASLVSRPDRIPPKLQFVTANKTMYADQYNVETVRLGHGASCQLALK
jgi:hypothetical protein